MTIRWPPGSLFLLQSAPKLLLPLAAVALAHRYLPPYVDISRFVWPVAYFLVNPVILAIKIICRRIGEEIEIKRLGARRLPQVPSRWPGGLDLLDRSVKNLNEGYIDDIWREWSELLGPTYIVRVLGEEMALTSEPEYLKAILVIDFDKFEKGEFFRGYAQSVLGTGVFNSDGEMWKFHRAMTRPFFARERITDFDIFNRHADVAIAKMKQRFSEGEPIDFQDIMSRFTLDSATEFLFGSCVHSLLAPLSYAWNSPRGKYTQANHPSNRFAVAFSEAQHHLSLRARRSVAWPLFEIWEDKSKDMMDVIYSYIDPLIKEALSRKSSNRDKSQVLSEIEGNNIPATLLSHLVEQTDDYTIIRDETVNIMIAGRDTTMATLTFVVYCLSQHREVLVKLREEILSKIGRTQAPTIEGVRQCRYLRAVINETLRLYPPVPFDVRRSKRATVWRAPDGGKPYYVPKDMEFVYSMWMMHRRTDLWGPDGIKHTYRTGWDSTDLHNLASEFDPERFLDERVHKYLTPNPFIFLPFNAGPRICPGQQFAYNEASFMLIRLLQTFDSIRLSPEAQPPASRPPKSWSTASGTQATDKVWPKSHLTLYSHMGLWMEMNEAKEGRD